MSFIPYMSYWSCGYQGPPTEYMKNLHWLAAYYLKLNYGEVHLVTDSTGKAALNNFEWSSVSTDLNELDPQHGKWFWASGKLKTFQLAAKAGRPFVHVDYDVFLPKGLPLELNDAAVFAQCPEDVEICRYELPRVFPLIPRCGILTEYKTRCAANTGVFGGNDLDFIHKYATEILDLAFHPENKILQTRAIYSHYGGASMLFEQYGLATAAKKHGVDISYVFPHWPSPKEAREKQFIHLMAAKRYAYMSEKISKIVTKLQHKQYGTLPVLI
jgi:hypothetical protein